MPIPDVVVIGAGPAGAATAIHLARRGRRVTLIDRLAAPRRKACGEGVFASGVRELATLDIEMADVAGGHLSAVRFHAGKHSVEAPLPGAGAYGVHRELLGSALVAQARAAGVNVVLGVSALGLQIANGRVAAIRTSAGLLEGCAFVAGDGLQSRIRRLASLDNSGSSERYGVSAHVTLPCESARTIDVYFQLKREIYITPLEGRSVNVAILLRRREMREIGGDLSGWFERELASIAGIDGFELQDEPLAAGPFARASSRNWRANLVLAGDAAGFLDGISGDGISAGLLGARTCAAAIDAYLTTGSYEVFRAYDRDRRAIVRNSNILAHVSLLLGRNERVANIAVGNLARQPRTFAKLVAINSRAAGFSSLRPRDLLALAFGV